MSITLAEHRRSRVPAVFAVLGVLAALIAGGTVYYTQFYETSSGDTPEQVVEKFLTVVVADNPDLAQLDTLICDSWDPAAAVQRTTSYMRANTHVSWQNIVRLRTSGEGRAVVEATITLTPIGDEDPSSARSWAFDMVDEKGWRVCDARPII